LQQIRQSVRLDFMIELALVGRFAARPRTEGTPQDDPRASPVAHVQAGSLQSEATPRQLDRKPEHAVDVTAGRHVIRRREGRGQARDLTLHLRATTERWEWLCQFQTVHAFCQSSPTDGTYIM
jgi:hypothetical protein